MIILNSVFYILHSEFSSSKLKRHERVQVIYNWQLRIDRETRAQIK